MQPFSPFGNAYSLQMHGYDINYIRSIYYKHIAALVESNCQHVIVIHWMVLYDLVFSRTIYQQ